MHLFYPAIFSSVFLFSMLFLVKLCGCVHFPPTHSFWHPQILLSVFWLLFEEPPPWSLFIHPFFPPLPLTEFRTCDGELLFSLCPQILSPFAFCLGSNHLTLGMIGCWVLYFPLKKMDVAYIISGGVKTLRNQENWSQEQTQVWLLKSHFWILNGTGKHGIPTIKYVGIWVSLIWTWEDRLLVQIIELILCGCSHCVPLGRSTPNWPREPPCIQAQSVLYHEGTAPISSPYYHDVRGAPVLKACTPREFQSFVIKSN